MKIAFLCAYNFFRQLFGVRNFFMTIAKTLGEKHDVEYIAYRETYAGPLWYKLTPSADADSIQTTQISLEGKAIAHFTRKKRQAFLDRQHKEQKQRYYYQYIGRDVSAEHYDVCVITIPWIVKEGIKIDAKRIVGIVHDFIANDWYLTNRNPILLGHKHAVGYDFYNRICNSIVANSKTVMEEYNTVFPKCAYKTNYLEPFPTYAFKNTVVDNSIPRERAVILAAPFDVRKGLKHIPALLNPLSGNIDVLYIYGGARCSEAEFNQFFKDIGIKRIEYFPSISYPDVISLYKKSQFLLFPSLEEGLGIPIIESQICGCRVVTTDAPPMNTLVLPGSYILSGDAGKDTAAMKSMLTEPFNYAGLASEAELFFSFADLENKILGT